MLDIFNELVNILANEYYNDKYIKKEINRIHYKMLYKPTKKQLTFFNRIYHYENFGVFEFTDFKLHNKLTLYFYLKENAKYFLKRKHFFDTSFWPVLKLYNENGIGDVSTEDVGFSYIEAAVTRDDQVYFLCRW